MKILIKSLLSVFLFCSLSLSLDASYQGTSCSGRLKASLKEAVPFALLTFAYGFLTDYAGQTVVAHFDPCYDDCLNLQVCNYSDILMDPDMTCFEKSPLKQGMVAHIASMLISIPAAYFTSFFMKECCIACHRRGHRTCCHKKENEESQN